MVNRLLILFVGLVSVVSFLAVTGFLSQTRLLAASQYSVFQSFAAGEIPCSQVPNNGSFFGFEPWYANLTCNSNKEPEFLSLGDIWLVVFALVDDAVILCGYLAVGFIVWGGIQYIKSRGNPTETTNALNTIINACIGLFIAIISVVIVQFITSKF